MALAPVTQGGDAADHPYTPSGTVRTFRVNNDGTFSPVVNITAASVLYGVQFTFTILAKTFDDDGGAYNQADAGGFIKLNALRMRIESRAGRK